MILENKKDIIITNSKLGEQAINNEKEIDTKEILLEVLSSIRDGGFNPVSQIVGYIESGDPTHIANYNNARTLIGKIDKDELLEEIVSFYINHIENNEDSTDEN